MVPRSIPPERQISVFRQGNDTFFPEGDRLSNSNVPAPIYWWCPIFNFRNGSNELLFV